MPDLQEKRNQIIKQETKLAQNIATQIMDKPKLSVWMILIPIVFLYYFYALNRFSSGRDDFIKNFIQSRTIVLDQACLFVEEKVKTDFESLARQDNVPEYAVEAYKKWAKALYDYYVKLLNAEGDDYPSLVKAGYKDQGRYLLSLNQINKSEVQFYKSLRDDVKSSENNVTDVIKKIDHSLTRLRRDDARSVFT